MTIVTMAKGMDTAVDTAPATTAASSRMPSTRQNPLRTSGAKGRTARRTPFAFQHPAIRGEGQHGVEPDKWSVQ